MARLIRHLARVAMAAAIAVAMTLSSAGLAPAQTENCPVTHSLRPYSDNAGGGWQLELEARCTEFEHSGVTDIVWSFRFWAETHDGDRILEYFSGDKASPEERSQEGQHHYVGVGAPLGFPRYCYAAHVTFEGLPTAPGKNADPLGYALGTHCKYA